jgi:exopolysaccharide biosynthesis predicted pyruvyltransferase EpsI
LSIEKRNFVFKELLKDIKQNNIVITDRLHGLIFCYITKTPCIAINSLNNKVKNAIDSYMLCDYIKMIEINELETSFQNNDNIIEDLIFREQVLILNKTEEYRLSFRDALKQ